MNAFEEKLLDVLNRIAGALDSINRHGLVERKDPMAQVVEHIKHRHAEMAKENRLVTQKEAMKELNIKDIRTFRGHCAELKLKPDQLTVRTVAQLRIAMEKARKRPNAAKLAKKTKGKTRMN